MAHPTDPYEQFRLSPRDAALKKGYQGTACRECGAFTLVKMGDLTRCDSCGTTTAPSDAPHPLDVLRAALQKALDALEHAALDTPMFPPVRQHVSEAIKDARKALE